MGFLYMMLIVAAITAFAYNAKLAAGRGVSSFDLTFVMFGAATVLGCFLARWNGVGSTHYTPELFSISAMAGLAGMTAVFVFNNAVRIGHFGFSNGIYRLSFLIPVVFSIVFFKAVLNVTTAAGIVLILVSIILVSWSNDSFSGKQNLKWFLLIVCAFALSGLPRIGQVLVSRLSLNSFAYLLLSYAVGFTALLIVFLFRIRRITPPAFLFGMIAAFVSYLGVYCTLEALKLLPAAIVFPVTLSAPIMLGMLISLMYRERVTPAGWIGIIAGTCGILILSLQIYAK